jgi:hypothetical protein
MAGRPPRPRKKRPWNRRRIEGQLALVKDALVPPFVPRQRGGQGHPAPLPEGLGGGEKISNPVPARLVGLSKAASVMSS